MTVVGGTSPFATDDIIGRYPGVAIDFNTFEAKRRRFMVSPASDGMNKKAIDAHLSE